MRKILILNWRDPKSPLEGGAERFTKKYAEFWAQEGNKVYWITNFYLGSNKSEIVNKVEYLRFSPILNGSLFSYLFNYPIYLIKTIFFANKFIKENNIDVVIDEIHGFPFFTPLFSKVRNILLVCEVAGPIWNKMFPFPINVIGKKFETLIYKIYAKSEIWAISENTKQNIQEILQKKQIKILPLGIDENTEILKKIKNVTKTKYPSAVFLARLVKMKGIETALRATAEITKNIPNFKLFVIGDGNKMYKNHLYDLVNTLQIDDKVEFLGKVSELNKFKYLKMAHFLFHPSYKEGFGLTILEAGLVGTPTIARKGSSMDLLIKHGYTGFLFNHDNNIKKYIDKILIENEELSRNTRKLVLNNLWNEIFKKKTL